MTSPRKRVAALSDPFNLSDKALLWRRIRTAPNAWNRRPMFEEVADHNDDHCDCGRFDEDADWGDATAARWPKPFDKDSRTFEGYELGDDDD